MVGSGLFEERRQRLKRRGKRWPKWLRSGKLLRWLFLSGPLIFRILRTVLSILGKDENG